MAEVNYRMFTHKAAFAIAEAVVKRIAPHCEVVNIAGSIRRQKPEVKDIEIVCVAKKVKTGNVDLFGNDNRKTIVSPEYTDVINSLGKIIKGKTDGRMMQIELKEKIILDLFMPEPIDYWRQFAIRTGSAEYSQQVIATGWTKKGWCGTADGLRLQKECNAIQYKAGKDVKGHDIYKNKWVVKDEITEPVKPPVWSSEKEFFDWLGVQYLHPMYRKILY
jgi:DNA polymerase/3'-5' exonuclease PolX